MYDLYTIRRFSCESQSKDRTFFSLFIFLIFYFFVYSKVEFWRRLYTTVKITLTTTEKRESKKEIDFNQPNK